MFMVSQWLEVSGVKRFWKDIAEVYYGISSTALTIRAVTVSRRSDLWTFEIHVVFCFGMLRGKNKHN